MQPIDIVMILSVILASLAVQAYALYHLFRINVFYRDKDVEDNSRTIWALIIIFGSILGALTYFVVVKYNE